MLLTTYSKQIPWGKCEKDFEKKIKRACNCWTDKQTKHTCVCKIVVMLSIFCKAIAMIFCIVMLPFFRIWNVFFWVWMEFCLLAKECTFRFIVWFDLKMFVTHVFVLVSWFNQGHCVWSMSAIHVLFDPSWNTDQGV